jgi:uncharacterized surface protein with fasciclin (FAS1) repeats
VLKSFRSRVSYHFVNLIIVHCGNTTIYEIASKLAPPGLLRPTSSEGMSLFRSFRHLIATNLDQRVIFDENAITVFLPVDHAWKSLGLTETYLLSSASGDALHKILLHGILNGIHYSKDFSTASKKYSSLDGETLSIQRDGDYIIFNNGMNVTMPERDILAVNGVAHSLSEVIIPSDVIITPENIINATGSSTWLNLLKHYNLSDYLELDANYTLLIPTDEAVNNTESFTTFSFNMIKSIVDTHIIPPRQNGRPEKLLEKHTVIQQSLSGQNLSIHQIYPDIWSVQIDNTSLSARILDQGRTSNGPQILLIDRVLFSPVIPQAKWIWTRPIALFIVAVAMIVSVVVGGQYLLATWRARRTKPLFEAGEPEETEPFLNGRTSYHA